MVPALLYVPEMVTRSSGVAANFLCDNAKYMLGIDTDGTNDRVKDCFQAAKEKHIALLKDVDNPMAKAICSFLKRGIRKMQKTMAAFRTNGRN